MLKIFDHSLRLFLYHAHVRHDFLGSCTKNVNTGNDTDDVWRDTAMIVGMHFANAIAVIIARPLASPMADRMMSPLWPRRLLARRIGGSAGARCGSLFSPAF
ncbi:MAG: hypothetical protein CSA09_00775 [Candidatus Contendobacter odensis]|uniref:Uncharacterized protein n=1 Tax=Candidatus Contendibacter odensensis TaxID=1400860 RepID=A0A2G6PFU7_9GAMM|nr:MAG: hypothetical protein CSA09_00775 [Candidatus Contendobacter odensis]